MSKKIIRASLNLTTGKLVLDLDGFQGEGCLELLNKLFSSLGPPETLTPKPEYFLPSSTQTNKEVNNNA